MTTVLASTDQVPELEKALAYRRAHGLDTYDEWWEGVYRFVTGPGIAHRKLNVRLGAYLLKLADEVGLDVSAPANIGVDQWDARVPDIVVFAPGTPMTSPASLASAELVVEILSPGEKAGEKLPFYAAWHAKEYLEIDLPSRSVRLLRVGEGGAWQPTDRSDVLGFTLAGDEFRAEAATYRIAWPE